jgi:hypothetical protein
VSLHNVRFSTDFGLPGLRVSSMAALNLVFQLATSNWFAAMDSDTTENFTFTRPKTWKVESPEAS